MMTTTDRSARRLLAGAIPLLAALGACGDSPTAARRATPPDLTVSVVASAVPYVACGAEIPVTATVTDNLGRPVSNLLLNFNVLAGGGSVYGGAAMTGGRGVAKDFWTVGAQPNVANTIAVRTVDGGGNRYTFFTQTVTTASRLTLTHIDLVGAGPWGYSEAYPDGSGLRLLAPGVGDGSMYSPDGTKIVSTDYAGGHPQLQVTDVATGQTTHLGAYGLDVYVPRWSPDGKRIAFTGVTVNHFENSYIVDADGSHLVTLPQPLSQSPDWLPDGRRLVFSASTFWQPSPVVALFVENADGTGVTQLSAGPRDQSPAVSPDGQTIAFVRGVPTRTDGAEIWTMDANGSNLRQLSNVGATSYAEHPTWSPDGKTLAWGVVEDAPPYRAYIVLADADGGNQRPLFPPDPNQMYLRPSWSKCAI